MMKHKENSLEEAYANMVAEKLQRPAGRLNPILTKAVAEFIKNNKKIKTDQEFQEAWDDKKNQKKFNETILAGILKKIDEVDIEYVTTNVSHVKWNTKNGRATYGLFECDFIINIGVADDVDGRKLGKKVRGWVNPPLRSNDVIFGKNTRDRYLPNGNQNIELLDLAAEFMIKYDK